MSASQAIIGRGTALAHSDAIGGSYAELAEITKCGSPKQSVTDVKVTHYQSPAGMHEYIPGWIEPGLVEYEANFLKADRDTVDGLIDVPAFYKIVLPDLTEFVFPGYIKEVSDDLPNDDRMTSKVIIKVTGAIDYRNWPAAITLTSPQANTTIGSGAPLVLTWTTDTGYVIGDVYMDDVLIASQKHGTYDAFGDTSEGGPTFTVKIGAVTSNAISVTIDDG